MIILCMYKDKSSYAVQASNLRNRKGAINRSFLFIELRKSHGRWFGFDFDFVRCGYCCSYFQLIYTDKKGKIILDNMLMERFISMEYNDFCK